MATKKKTKKKTRRKPREPKKFTNEKVQEIENLYRYGHGYSETSNELESIINKVECLYIPNEDKMLDAFAELIMQIAKQAEAYSRRQSTQYLADAGRNLRS